MNIQYHYVLKPYVTFVTKKWSHHIRHIKQEKQKILLTMLQHHQRLYLLILYIKKYIITYSNCWNFKLNWIGIRELIKSYWYKQNTILFAFFIKIIILNNLFGSITFDFFCFIVINLTKYLMLTIITLPIIEYPIKIYIFMWFDGEFNLLSIWFLYLKS